MHPAIVRDRRGRARRHAAAAGDNGGCRKSTPARSPSRPRPSTSSDTSTISSTSAGCRRSPPSIPAFRDGRSERYADLGAGWFVRRHAIEYLRPVFAGDALTILTWVEAFGRSSSPRRYLFHRAGDAQVVARAETLWVFVSYATGAPLRIPADLKDAFEVATEAEALRALRA